jgi:zinc protease
MYAKRFAFMLFTVGALLGARAGAASLHIEHWTLDNGARVYFVEAHELPMVQIEIAFDAGSARDVSATSGLALLTSQMLAEGAGKLDADQVATEFERRGAEYGASGDRDMATVTVRSLSERTLLDPALDVLALVLSSPTFPAASLERQRAQALVALQQEAQSPGEVASKAFYQAVYGAHPYALHPSGTDAGLRAIRREDLIAFHHRYYVAGNAVMAIVGDLSVDQARRVSQRLFAKLPKGEAAPALPAVPPSTPDQRVINFPSSQTHVLVGQAGIRRSDPDYFPLLVGNYTLGGGGLVSRLSEEIREKRGLSYSVYSYFYPFERKGPFIMGLQTKNAQREEAKRLMRETLAGYLRTGPTEAELRAAKEFLTGSFPLRLDSNRKIADNLIMIGFYRLPLTYLEDFVPKVRAVTSEQIRAAFQRHLAPDRMDTVMVGGAPK